MINILNRSFIPIQVEHKDSTILVYVATYNKRIYLNINSLCDSKNITVNKWKRRKIVRDLIKDLDNRSTIFKPVFSLKNKGTWIIKDLVKDFGNWFGEKKIGFTDLGTFLDKNLVSLYRSYTPNSDPFFTKIDGHIIRANRKTHFINLTDIINIYKKDIRNLKN